MQPLPQRGCVGLGRRTCRSASRARRCPPACTEPAWRGGARLGRRLGDVSGGFPWRWAGAHMSGRKVKIGLTRYSPHRLLAATGGAAPFASGREPAAAAAVMGLRLARLGTPVGLFVARSSMNGNKYSHTTVAMPAFHCGARRAVPPLGACVRGSAEKRKRLAPPATSPRRRSLSKSAGLHQG